MAYERLVDQPDGIRERVRDADFAPQCVVWRHEGATRSASLRDARTELCVSACVRRGKNLDSTVGARRDERARNARPVDVRADRPQRFAGASLTKCPLRKESFHFRLEAQVCRMHAFFPAVSGVRRPLKWPWSRPRSVRVFATIVACELDRGVTTARSRTAARMSRVACARRTQGTQPALGASAGTTMVNEVVTPGVDITSRRARFSLTIC